jgi:CubicO group peptidase (beta-lactamase class C family)
MISKLLATAALIGVFVATLTITPIHASQSTQPFKITDEIKDRINALVDANRTNAAIVIGIVDPNGTQFYSNGKLSKANNSNVNENTIFAIGSITKVFTTILLADAVQEGVIKLNDPVDIGLPLRTWLPIHLHYQKILQIYVQLSQKQIHKPLMKKFKTYLM